MTGRLEGKVALISGAARGQAAAEEHVDPIVAGEIHGAVQSQPAPRVLEQPHDPGDRLVHATTEYDLRILCLILVCIL